MVTKHRYSSFANTTLETLLRGNDVNELLVGGLNTNVCVASTVQDAFDHDYDVTILSDCSATTQPEFHRPYLESLERNGFARVRESGDVELSDAGGTIPTSRASSGGRTRWIRRGQRWDTTAKLAGVRPKAS